VKNALAPVTLCALTAASIATSLATHPTASILAQARAAAVAQPPLQPMPPPIPPRPPRISALSTAPRAPAASDLVTSNAQMTVFIAMIPATRRAHVHPIAVAPVQAQAAAIQILAPSNTGLAVSLVAPILAITRARVMCAALMDVSRTHHSSVSNFFLLTVSARSLRRRLYVFKYRWRMLPSGKAPSRPIRSLTLFPHQSAQVPCH